MSVEGSTNRVGAGALNLVQTVGSADFDRLRVKHQCLYWKGPYRLLIAYDEVACVIGADLEILKCSSLD